MSSTVGYSEIPHHVQNENFRFADFEATILGADSNELVQLQKSQIVDTSQKLAQLNLRLYYWK